MFSNKDVIEMGRPQNVVNTAIWMFAQMMVLHIGAFTTTMYLARMLPTNEYGLIPLLNALVLLFVAIVGLGVPNALARYVAAQESRAEQKAILVRAILAILPWALISIAVLVLVFPIIARSMEEPSLDSLRWVFICVLVLELFRVFVEKICQGATAMKISANYSLWAAGLTFLVTVPIILVHPTALAALWAKAAALTLPSLRLLIALKKLFLSNKIVPDKALPTGREVVKYGIPLAMISLSGFGFIQADILMLGYFGDSSMVGMYAISVFLFTRLTLFSRAIGSGIAPLFAKKTVGQKERVWFLLRGLKYALIVAIPVALYMGINGEALIVLLFGEGFVGTGATVAFLGIYFIMSSILSVINPTLDFVGKAKIRALGTLIGATMNVILNIILIPIYGVIGAAIATIIGYSFFAAIVLGAVAELLRTAIRDMPSLGRLLFLIGPMLFFLLLVVRALNEDASAAINAALICTLYPAALFTFNVISKKEILAVKQNFSNSLSV